MLKRVALFYVSLLLLFVGVMTRMPSASQDDIPKATVNAMPDSEYKVMEERMPDPIGDIAFALLGLLRAQAPEPPNCPDQEKPWMCGDTEHACSRSGHKVEGDDTVYWHACSCKHKCKEGGKPEDETQGREWDATCKARCKPWHCHCGPKGCGHT